MADGTRANRRGGRDARRAGVDARRPAPDRHCRIRGGLWCGLLAAFISRSGDTAEEGVVTVRDLVAGVSGFALGSVVIVAAILYNGTSLSALFDGLFVAPQLLPKVFWRPLPVPLLVAAIAPASLCAACYSRRGGIAFQQWMPVAALACGLTMFVLSITKTYPVLFAMGPLLAWVVLADRSGGAAQRAGRGMLAFAAILIALQAYPMPEGTQIVVGTLLFVPLALATIPGRERTLDAQRPPAAQRSVGRRAIFAALAVAAAGNIGMTRRASTHAPSHLGCLVPRRCAPQHVIRRHING